SPFTFRHTRLTVSLLTAPPKTAESARRTRRVLVRARYSRKRRRRFIFSTIGFDAIEIGLRERVREFIQAMIESELETALARPRHGGRPTADAQKRDGSKTISGHRHGHRSRSLMGTFGRVEIEVSRARLDTAEGKTTEWKSSALRAYHRRTKQADSLIAGAR